MVTRGKWWGQGELNEDGQRVQTFNYKISTNNVMYTMTNIITTPTYIIYESCYRSKSLAFSLQGKNIFSFISIRDDA